MYVVEFVVDFLFNVYRAPFVNRERCLSERSHWVIAGTVEMPDEFLDLSRARTDDEENNNTKRHE